MDTINAEWSTELNESLKQCISAIMHIQNEALQFEHRIVETLGKGRMDHHDNDYAEHKTDQKRRDEKQEEMFTSICEQISSHTCTQSLETKTVVETLVTRTEEQNGHLRALEMQGTTLLSIAKGRESLWKEVGIVAGAVTAFAGVISGIVFGFLHYFK